MSLVDKLNNVHIGDFIILSNPELNIGGYVLDYGVETVKLGHEDPKSYEHLYNRPLIDKIRDNRKGHLPKGSKFFSGNRRYKLEDFDQFNVLKEAETY